MLKILCTGDSHTWGQGATGLMEEFSPAVVAGEPRLASFRSDCYVNRLRRMVAAATGSEARDWTAQMLARLPGAAFEEPCAVVGAEGIKLPFKGELVRVQCALSPEPSEVQILVNDVEQCSAPLMGEKGCYRLFTLHLPAGEHSLTIRATNGQARVYRVESYAGPCAVVNGGVGSRSVNAFRKGHWQQMVLDVRPDVVLMEAHTINDWLTGEMPDEYSQALVRMIEAFRALGSEVFMLTVAPIGGPQILPGLAGEYEEFIQAGYQAAQESGACLCDAHELMRLATAGMMEEQKAEFLFADNWHVNDRGHAIYAQVLFEALRNGGYLGGLAGKK